MAIPLTQEQMLFPRDRIITTQGHSRGNKSTLIVLLFFHWYFLCWNPWTEMLFWGVLSTFFQFCACVHLALFPALPIFAKTVSLLARLQKRGHAWSIVQNNCNHYKLYTWWFMKNAKFLQRTADMFVADKKWRIFFTSLDHLSERKGQESKQIEIIP